jgi:hypothetical protein
MIVKALLAVLLVSVAVAWPIAQTAVPPSGAPTVPPSATPVGPVVPPVLTAPQGAGTAVTPLKYVSAPDEVLWFVFGVMTLILLGGIAALPKILGRDKDWTFADAMSGPDGKPSISRLIAFLGLLVMVVVILGIGYSSLWVFLKTGQLPSLSGATTFLVACAGLFAPYVANQIGLAFGGTTSTQLAPVVLQSLNSTPQMGLPNVPSVAFGAPMRPPTS